VVHGGGTFATELSGRLGIPVETINGRRITDAATLEVAKMAFNGKLNTDLVAALQKHGVRCVGLSGIDGALVRAERRPVTKVEVGHGGETREIDFGFVGDVKSVDIGVIRHLLAGSFLPVVSSMAGDGNGGIFNINADTLATALAKALCAEKLILLTAAPGVLEDADDERSLISWMDRKRLGEILERSASGGMVAKLQACGAALDAGVPRTHIISGKKRDSLLVEIFTNEGSGTLIEESGPEQEAVTVL
jgi:acetylglutamate kinase